MPSELTKKQKKQLNGALKVYTPIELEYYGRDMEWITKARNQRESNWEFFDGLSYTKDYYLNRRAANTYLRPKKNDDEVRVSSGTTEKKIEVVANEILSINLQHEIIAFNKDDIEIEELGEDIGDVVTRTNEIERDEDIWRASVWELLTQRAVYLQERFVTEVTKDFGRKERIRRFPKKSLISGLKVFLGDISIPEYEFDKQPYVVTYDRIHKANAEKLYGNLKNFKHTKAGTGSLEAYTGAFDFRLGVIDEDEYEVIEISSYCEDYRQLYLNGVMMYKPETEESKLPYEYPGYDIKMFGLRGMSNDFAYSKPLTASSKVMQGMSDESLRFMVRRWKQAIEPPLAVKGKKKYSRDIFQAGAMTYGLGKDEFEKIVDNDGITQGDFNMYELINRKTEEFIGAGSLQQGLGGEGQQTATETVELQRNFMKSLGFAVYAYMRMKREMTYLRIYNVLENMTSPTSKEIDPLTQNVIDIYQKFTAQETNIEGRTGKKLISFNDRNLEPTEIENIYEREKKDAKIGKVIRYKNINIKKLLEIPITWYVNIIQKQQAGSALDKVMFKDKMAQAMPISQIAGRQLNSDKLVEDFERTWNAEDWFSKDVPMPEMGGMGMPGQSQEGSQLEAGLKSPMQKPSVNNLVNQNA